MGLLSGLESSWSSQWDDEPGGGFADQTQDFLIMTDDPANDDFIMTGWPKALFDTIWAYEEDIGGQYTDEVDVPGAALWGTDTSFVEDPAAAVNRTVGDTYTWFTGDWDSSVSNNQQQSGDRGKWLIWAAMAGIALWLLAPILEIAANLSD